MQVFAFLETSHLFNGLFWPLTTIKASRWQDVSGIAVCKYLARGGHSASLENACLGDVMWKDQSGQFKVKSKFRTPEAVGAAFREAAEGGHLAMCSRLQEKYSWDFFFSHYDVWFYRSDREAMCEAAAKSGSMELLEWMKDTGLPMSWGWVRSRAVLVRWD